VNWVNHIFDEEWSIRSAGGLTGEALFAKRENKQLFLKRNTTPFLAVLSAQEIVPKLIWTKRLHNGDVITAQKWVEGRKLSKEEMYNKDVLQTIKKIHHSPELLHMLMRLGKTESSTTNDFAELKAHCFYNGLDGEAVVYRSLMQLKALLPATKQQEQAVCHCDLNHNNFMYDEVGKLYLVDWDQASIADPAKDYGNFLYYYIAENDWKDWLYAYGVEINDALLRRIYWYILYEVLSYVVWHKERREERFLQARMKELQHLEIKIKEKLF